MRFKNADKGVAGLTILLSLVTLLFTIGLLVMIFSLMGGELQEATFTTETTTNESYLDAGVLAFANSTGYDVANVGDDATGTSFVGIEVWAEYFASNGTFVGSETWGGYNVSLDATNWSLSSAGSLTNTTTGYGFPNVSVSYTWSDQNTATDVMNDTVVSVASVTDWFPIFIVIGAMVVLILLTVIIITAIRGSGLMAGGTG